MSETSTLTLQEKLDIKYSELCHHMAQSLAKVYEGDKYAAVCKLMNTGIELGMNGAENIVTQHQKLHI